jgi:hypothetical protein
MTTEVLNEINRKLDILLSGRSHGATTKPYELPPLGPSEVVIDGLTRNADGSVWGRTLGDSGDVIRIQFGYVSEAKCPEVWSAMRAFRTPEDFKAWDDEMKANPWRLYRADPRAVLGAGANFVLLGYALQHFGEHVPG